MLTEIARKVFAQDSFAALTGISIDHVDLHQCRCTLTLDSRHLNARGVAMGGVLFTLADFSAAVAANSADLAEGTDLHWVSLGANIHYLAPADCQQLVAECKAIKHGRTTALYQTVISDAAQGRVIAVSESTMMRV